MVRGRKLSCKYSIRQGNEIRMVDREYTIIRSSKYGIRTTFSTFDINSTRKKGFQSAAGLVQVCMIVASFITHSWNTFGSTQVGQSTAFYVGEDGSTKVRGSPSSYTGHGGSDKVAQGGTIIGTIYIVIE